MNYSGSGNQERLHRILVTAGIVVVLSVAVVALRFYRLSDMPLGIQNDEGPDGVYALEVLQGEHAVFFPEKGSGRDAVGVYANALSTALFGRTLLAFHLPVAFASAATVFAVFWLGQLLFGRDEESSGVTFWRGLLISGSWSRSVGRFHRPDVSVSGRVASHLSATVSFPEFCPTLVGMEKAKSLGDWAGWHLRWSASLHLQRGPFYTFPFSLSSA